MNTGKLLKTILPASLLLLAVMAWIAYRGTQINDSDVPTAQWLALEEAVTNKIQVLRQAVISGQGKAEDWGQLAQAFHAHGLLEQAAECYSRAQEGAPADYRWPYLRAVAVQQASPNLAIDLYKLTATLADNYLPLHIRLGRLLAEQQLPDQATAEFNAALALEPGNLHAQLGLAEIELAAGRLQVAQSMLEQILGENPTSAEAWRLQATLQSTTGKHSQAGQSLARAKRYREPTELSDPLIQAMLAGAVDTGAKLGQARRVLEQGRTGQAIEVIQGIIDTDPGYADAYAAMGDAQAMAQHWDRARWALERALDLGEQPPSTYLRLADVLQHLNQTGRAQDVLQRGTQAHPEDAGLALAAAESEWAEGRTGEAAASYRKVLQLDAGQAIAHHRLAQWMQDNGQPDQATAGWARALELQPDLAEARYALADAQIAKGLHAEAVATLLAGLELNASDTRCNMLLAWELATAPEESLRDGERALKLAQQVYAAEPGNARAADIYAAALAEAGQFAAAADIANKAMDLVGYVDQQDYADEIRRRRDAYIRSLPYRQPL